MIRVVLAVVLAAGLLAVSLPALDAARADRATARIDRFSHRLSVAATELANSEAPVRPASAGAHRIVDVTLPRKSIAVAPITSLVVRCHPTGDIELGFTVDDDRKRARVPISTPVAIDGQGQITPTDRPKVRLTFDRLAVGPTVVFHPTATTGSPETDSTRSEDSTARTGPPTPCSESTSRGSARPRASGRVPVPPRSKPPP